MTTAPLAQLTRDALPAADLSEGQRQQLLRDRWNSYVLWSERRERDAAEYEHTQWLNAQRSRRQTWTNRVVERTKYIIHQLRVRARPWKYRLRGMAIPELVVPEATLRVLPANFSQWRTSDELGTENAETHFEVAIISVPQRSVDELRRDLDAVDTPWVALAGMGDVREGALSRLVEHAAHTGCDVVFGDSEEIADDGSVTRVAFRSEQFGAQSLWSGECVGPLQLWRSDVLRRVGFREAPSGTASWFDAVIRAWRDAVTFSHVAHIVFRECLSGDVRRVSGEARVWACRSDLERENLDGEVCEDGRGGARWKMSRGEWPSVSIVIPTRDRVDLLSRCVESVRALSEYPNYEIVVADNDSCEEETEQWLIESNVRVVRTPGDFNYARIMNEAITSCSSDVIVTLNNDTVVTSSDWLSQMVAVAMLDDVGVVGVRLRDPRSGDVVHAGVVIDPMPRHVVVGAKDGYSEQIGLVSRNVLAVTGACTAMRRELFVRLGGMDEVLSVEFNDTDLCLRAYELGRSSVYLDTVEVLHAESSSRGKREYWDNRLAMMAKWDLLGGFRDPYTSSVVDFLGGTNSCVVRPEWCFDGFLNRGERPSARNGAL